MGDLPVGTTVQMTDEYIREAFDNGMDKLYAHMWRGKIISVEDGYYKVATVDCPDEIQDFCWHVVEAE